MLLLLKTNDCLRHADRQLGSPVNSFVVTLRHCVIAIRADEAERRRQDRIRAGRVGGALLALRGWLSDAWLAFEELLLLLAAMLSGATI
jgi:hypothetical protein